MKAFTQKLISLTKAVVAFEEKNDNVSSVESQTEASRQAGSIWNATRMGNKEEVMRLLAKNPALVTTRGPVGEVPLHLCFLYNAPAHLEIAEAMMDAYPHVIPEQYIGDEYGGENVLHIAIIQKNYAWVKRLVAMCPALMKGAATGRFFRHGEPCYYGEYPLAFAACTNQPDMVQTLIEAGADMNIVDSHGNTLLHLLVIHNLPKMYALCKQGWIERYQEHNTTLDKAHRAPELWLRKNSDGHTPFTLAASMGQKNMFSFLLEERKIVQWTYGPVSCVLYPLDQLDLAARLADYKPEAEVDASQQGALEHIVNAAHLDLLMHPRIIDLVQRKWDCFANRIFIQRFIIVAIYLFIFTVTTITRQTYYHRLEETQALHEAQAATAASQGLPPPEIDWNEYSPPWSLYVGYVIVLFGAIYKALREVTEMSQSGVANYFSSSGSAFLENLLSLSFSACIMLVVILHILGSPAERAVLALASICGYSYILFFLLGFRLTGPMVVMIYEMLFNDVLRFCITYSVFLFGFAQAFFILFDSVGVSGFGESIKTCFVAMLGDFDFSTYSESPFQSVSVGLLVIYVVVVTILLLNLLIAMMGDTYGRINENAEKQWELERARIVFAIENEMSSEERNHISNKYFTLVDGERYLQIQEVNRNHFRDPDDPAVTPSDDSD